MASEALKKFDPRRTMHLGVSPLTATLTAAIHSVSESALSVSGVFRDRVDLATLFLYDADDYFGHPRFKPLPDFAFDGMVLEFDLLQTNLQPIESPKFAWVDWPFLNVTTEAGENRKIRLFDHATLVAYGSWPAAFGAFTFQEGGGIANFDRVTLFYLGIGWDYIVPQLAATFAYFASGVGVDHSVTIGPTTYHYIEQAGDSSAMVAAGVAAAAAGDPNASAIAATNNVTVTRLLDTGAALSLAASDGNGPATIYQVKLETVVRWFATAISDSNWTGIGAPLALRASAAGAVLTISAARYGTVSVAGASVFWVTGEKFSGLSGGDPIRVAGVEHTIAAVISPSELLLTAAAANGGAYTAPHGGYDGAMVRVYERHTNANLQTTAAMIQLAGASSEVTWRIRIDFSALDIARVRQMWLTFAPRLTDGVAYANTEWTARISGITVSDPNGRRALKVADPAKSVRVGSRSAWSTYSAGGGWIEDASNVYFRGFARSTSTVGAKVTVEVWSGYAHDLWLGLTIGAGHGLLSIRVDGDAPTTLDAALGSGLPARRKIRAGLAAGRHIVEVTLAGAGVLRYDYLDVVVESDAPDPEAVYADVAVATDYDTDHSYRLAGERVAWSIHRSGLRGRVNHFVGILFYAQRNRINGVFPALAVTFGGTWVSGDTATITLGGVAITKTCVAADTISSIAEQFAGAINAVFSACWAQAVGAVLTITVRSPIDVVEHSTAKSSAAGTINESGSMGSLAARSLGTYVIDGAAEPPFDLAARSWHADFFAACRNYGLEVVSTFSFDMTNPPEDPGGGQVWASRYANGDQATFEVVPGFGGTHCTFSATILAYQKRVYKHLADLMVAAGIGIWLQFGEFLWWYVQGTAAQKTAFYDSDTAAAAQAALGRALHVFETLTDDPAVNAFADADFLRARLQAHIDAIRAHVLASHASARFELLWARDVNRDDQQLSLYVNLPPTFWQKAGSGLDSMKVEALNFGGYTHDLNAAIEAIGFMLVAPRAWTAADLWYNLPILTPSSVFARELVYARGLDVKVSLWAWDHFALKALPLPLPEAAVRGALAA